MMMYTKQTYNVLVRAQLQISCRLTVQEFGEVQLPPFKHCDEHTAKKYNEKETLVSSSNHKIRIKFASVTMNFDGNELRNVGFIEL